MPVYCLSSACVLPVNFGATRGDWQFRLPHSNRRTSAWLPHPGAVDLTASEGLRCENGRYNSRVRYAQLT